MVYSQKSPAAGLAVMKNEKKEKNMFNFDSGNEEVSGPFVNWHARGREDGTADAKSFSLKDGEERTDVTDKFKKGVVFDIKNMKTGWGRFNGETSEWTWNASLAKFEKKPGDDWKKAVSIPVAFGKEKSAVWQQSGAGTWEAVSRLAKEIQGDDQPKGKLPKIKMTSAETIKFKNGSTAYAVLEVEKWVDTPECLLVSEEDLTPSDVEADSMIDDDDEF